MNIRNKSEVHGMLLQFKFSNFRSFAEETIFDMTATTIKEHKYSLIQRNSVDILPVAAVYGANASGKSSFFMAFERMKLVVTERYLAQNSSGERKSKPYSTPFMFDENIKKEKSSYEVRILINDYVYRYGFTCNNDNILSEHLYKRKLSKNKTVEKLIFKRDSNETTLGKVNADIKNEIEYCSSMATSKILILTDVGLRRKCKELCSIFSWFIGVDVLLNASQEVMTINGNSEDLIGALLADENFDNKIKEQYKALIMEIDPSISDIVIENGVDKEGNAINIAKTQHIYNGKRTDTFFSTESEGTNKFFFLAIFLLISIDNGLPIFIDELDSKLHPLLLRKIVQMFTNKETNPKGAQLIFSAHNIISLDSSSLRRDEIWFVEKENHISSMYSLADFEDDDGSVRSDLNYGKHYLSGRFGAVPFQNEVL